MVSGNVGLVLVNHKIGQRDFPAIEFSGAECSPLAVDVIGRIANSVDDSERQRKWKVNVASAVMEKRGEVKWNSDKEFAISIGFVFHPSKHGYRTNAHGQAYLDVENFVKPVVDAIAAGLFCGSQADLDEIKRWDCDDSNFKTLLIHRLPDARTPQEEGIAVCVSSK